MLVLWSIGSWKVWQQLIKTGTHDRARTRRRLCQLRNSPFVQAASHGARRVMAGPIATCARLPGVGRAAPAAAGPGHARRAARGGVTGPPWPFAGNPLTPQTSGGNHVHRTPMETEWPGQGQPPRIMNRLRDIRKLVRGSTRRCLSRRSGRWPQGHWQATAVRAVAGRAREAGARGGWNRRGRRGQPGAVKTVELLPGLVLRDPLSARTGPFCIRRAAAM